MRVWAVSNQKGGVGKTTTVANLAGLLARRGERVLVIDLDPHSSLSAYFGFDPEQVESGVYDLFRAVMQRQPLAPQRHIQPTSVDSLDILPAAMALATIERQAGAVEGLGRVIQRALGEIAPDYDRVLIDSPPMLGVLMVNALAACERLLIPVVADFLSLRGLERMLRTLAMIGRSRRQPLPYLIVPTLYDRRPRISADTLRVLEERYGERLWPSVIPQDTKVREASRAHLPLCHYHPRSRAALAYETLLDYLLEQEGHPITQAVSA
ncbi:chromosome partitioning protein [Methylomarinovum tepidoasis]|uniref:Chromosome partitioning protein n=1 Tax=Methylomarinovum tepidoasis TaxID=2840183 RepID=A0AAU9CBB8_9GAMM|nr:ParA family protein [Methylomarinovum sp. IN45]BCX89216.1 chromosome partitioning protein [Methylomarinovum sp. IN45]